MIDPQFLDARPDGSIMGTDVVALSRYLALLASYKELYEKKAQSQPLARGLTLDEKLAVLYPRKSVAALVSLLYRATEPSDKRAIAAACGVSAAAFGSFLNRARREDGLQIICTSQQRAYGSDDELSVTLTHYALARASRTALDAVLEHPAVAYSDDALVVVVLKCLTAVKAREREPGLSAMNITVALPEQFSSAGVQVIKLVLNQLELSGLILTESRNKQTFKISNEGRAYLKAHTST